MIITSHAVYIFSSFSFSYIKLEMQWRRKMRISQSFIFLMLWPKNEIPIEAKKNIYIKKRFFLLSCICLRPSDRNYVNFFLFFFSSMFYWLLFNRKDKKRENSNTKIYSCVSNHDLLWSLIPFSFFIFLLSDFFFSFILKPHLLIMMMILLRKN